MALGFVARAAKAGLAKTGEPSLLRGVSCGKAAFARKVEVQPGSPLRVEDNYVGVYDMAWIDADYEPKVGDTFDHPDGAFLLDRLVSDNGFVRQFIVVARP